jgi:hypothetical protein
MGLLLKKLQATPEEGCPLHGAGLYSSSYWGDAAQNSRGLNGELLCPILVEVYQERGTVTNYRSAL